MIDNQLQKTDTRREFVTKVLGGAAALAIAGAVVGGGFASPVSAGTTYFKTTTALNLRSEANTTSAVILVIPKGGQVMQVGPDLNGFKKVSYAGKTGYAFAKYLVLANDGGSDMPAYRGVAITTTAVNMRAGAGINYSILRVIPSGATIEVYDEYANYYWLVRYQGQFGYVRSNYMYPNGGGPQF